MTILSCLRKQKEETPPRPQTPHLSREQTPEIKNEKEMIDLLIQNLVASGLMEDPNKIKEIKKSKISPNLPKS